MDPMLLQPVLIPLARAHFQNWWRAPSKNAEAYGDSLAVESLNATVLVEFPVSKGPILLRS
jgi:hypothetical protein